MTLEQAVAFVTHVNDQTGRYPGLYSGHLHQGFARHDFRPCPRQLLFWLSQYGPTAVVPAQLAYLDHVANTPMVPPVLSPIPSQAPESVTATSSTAMKPASAPFGCRLALFLYKKRLDSCSVPPPWRSAVVAAEIVSTALAKRHPPNPAKQDPAPPPACRTPR